MCPPGINFRCPDSLDTQANQMRLGRAAVITLSIAAVGALMGGVIGAALVAAWGLVLGVGGRSVAEGAAVGSANGAALGAVIAPITAWTLMRRVPLGRALAQTAIGTTLGAAIGLAVGSFFALKLRSLPGAFLGALIGFVATALRLRFATRPSRTHAQSASRPPESDG